MWPVNDNILIRNSESRKQERNTMQPTTRRHFFYSAGMALTALEATRVMGANERVHMGVVGLGGRGQAHMKNWAGLPDAQIVALCDVDQASLERGQALVEKLTQSKPKGYPDMKE